MTRVGTSALLTIALAVLAWPCLQTQAAVNSWSLGFVKTSAGAGAAYLGQMPAGHQRATLWLAELALKRGDVGDALSALTRKVAEAPADQDARVLLGDALEQSGRMDEAIRDWKEAGAWPRLLKAGWDANSDGRWDDAIRAFQAASGALPLDAQLGLAQAFQGKKDFPGAEAVLRSGLASLPGFSPTMSLQWHMTLGDVLSAQGRWQEAAGEYRAAISIDEQYANAYIALGTALSHTDGVSAGENQIQKGITLRPHEANGYEAMGDVLRANQRFAEADKWYLEAIAQAPDDPALWQDRAGNAWGSGDSALAVSYYLEVTTRFAGVMKPASLATVYRNLANAAWDAHNSDESLAAIQQSVALNPSDSQNWIAAGQIYERVKDVPRALESYRRALSVDPSSASAADGIARLTR